jgi:branched-chain amino acid transport system ATP-binding protein
MLEVKNIDVAYGDVQVLWDVSFKVNEGEILVLVGANGAGKSTTLKTISSLLPVKSGEILFLGQRLDNLPPHVVIAEGVVQVPEGRRLFAEMTVEENLIMGSLSRTAKPQRRESLEWVYSLFPRLLERRKQPAGTLSGGEQQMVAVGRGLMARPKLLMFDEPSLGLAPLLVEDIFKIVQKINQEGVTTLLVEQNVNLTLQFCHRAYVMENGRITLTGSGQELLNNDHVRQAYLGI